MKTRALCVTLALTAMTLPAIAAETSSCVPKNANARISWTAASAEPVRAVRAYFRSDAATAEHFVELRRAGNVWSGVLPKASTAAEAIEYRIATAAANGQFTTRHDGRITVSSTCNAKPLDASEQALAKALIVGLTKEGPAVPAGFRCDGIIGQVTPQGALKSYAACSELAATSGDQPQVADASSTSSKEAAAQATATTKSAAAPAVADTEGVTASATRRPRLANGGGNNPVGPPRRPGTSQQRP